MRITVLVLRLLETGLLLWSIYSLHFTTHAPDLTTFTEMSGYHYQWFEFSIDPDSHRVVVSTLLIGYAMSLAGTLLQRRGVPRILWSICLVAAALGAFSYANELVRLWLGYERYQFEVIIHTGILLVMADWLLFGLAVAKSSGSQGPARAWTVDEDE